MIELEVKRKVLDELKRQFPKPENSAQRALKKYVSALEGQLRESQLIGRNGLQQKNNWFHISLSKLRNGGGQIGPNKIRLQNWLEDNNLELFKVIEKGSNFSQKLSHIQLSKFVSIKKILTPADDVSVLAQDAQLDDTAYMLKFYPGIGQLTKAQIRQKYDCLPVDRRSLQNYIRWLNEPATLICSLDKERLSTQANHILRIASCSDGLYLQKRKLSSYGRVYYEGTSVQNVSKTLREAMIGQAYEYDIKSAVFTWKMCCVKEACPNLQTDEQVKKAFSNTLWLLTEKQDFFHHIRAKTFDPVDYEDNKGTNKEKKRRKIPEEKKARQIKLIKQAFTALGFGARLNGTGWTYAGKPHVTAISEILENTEDKKRFVSCREVRGFVKEQAILDNFLFDQAKNKPATFFGDADVKTASGRLSKAKVIAYLYQTFETQLMNKICDMINGKGIEVIARIHDAIITKQKLTANDLSDILFEIRKQTENPYWNMSHKELKPFFYDDNKPKIKPISHEKIKRSSNPFLYESDNHQPIQVDMNDLKQLQEWANKLINS